MLGPGRPFAVQLTKCCRTPDEVYRLLLISAADGCSITSFSSMDDSMPFGTIKSQEVQRLDDAPAKPHAVSKDELLPQQVSSLKKDRIQSGQSLCMPVLYGRCVARSERNLVNGQSFDCLPPSCKRRRHACGKAPAYELCCADASPLAAIVSGRSKENSSREPVAVGIHHLEARCSSKALRLALQLGAEEKVKCYDALIYSHVALQMSKVPWDVQKSFKVYQKTPLRVLHRRSLATRYAIYHSSVCL